MLTHERELVLMSADLPAALLAQRDAPLVARFSHRLLDPFLLEQLEQCATGQTTPASPVVVQGEVSVFELSPRTRRALTRLTPGAPAVAQWLQLEEAKLARATLDEVPALLDCFKRAAMSSAIHALEHAWLRVRHGKLGLG